MNRATMSSSSPNNPHLLAAATTASFLIAIGRE
jgi:hypothetical protein